MHQQIKIVKNIKRKSSQREALGRKVFSVFQYFRQIVLEVTTKHKVDTVGHLDAELFTFQKTHFERKGKFNTEYSGFDVFETIRPKHKGGSLIKAHRSLEAFPY